jgi:hypothetical protein
VVECGDSTRRIDGDDSPKRAPEQHRRGVESRGRVAVSAARCRVAPRVDRNGEP